VEKIWMSIFTPQKGAANAECLGMEQRKFVVQTLLRMSGEDNKLDMRPALIREFLAPPTSPGQCIFAKTTLALSADLRRKIEPCQFGGNPDCSQCGCMASMALAAVGHKKVVGPLTAGRIFWTSAALGDRVAAVRHTLVQKSESILRD